MVSDKQNIWFTFLIAAILIVVLGQLLPKKPEKYLKDRFWVLKTHKKADCNFIVLGDSRVYRGISPYEIECILPEFKVQNFAFSNGGLNTAMFDAAEKKLVSDQPKIILLGVSAFSINYLSKANKLYLQELSRPKEEVFERRYLNKYLNYFSPVTPEEVRDLINKVRPPVNYISIYHDNGWVESEKFPADTMEAMPYYKKDFALHTTDYKLVDELCERINSWNNAGIKVFAFRPPASVPMVALEDSVGNYNEQLIKMKIEKAGGLWINIDPTKYKTYDGSHLFKGDARKLSIKIATEIGLKIGE